MYNSYESYINSAFGDGVCELLDEPMYDYYREYAEYIVGLLNMQNKGDNKSNAFEFGYRDYPSVNGSSYCEDNVDKVQISRGVIERSYELFNNFITCIPDLKNFNKNNLSKGIKYVIQLGEKYGHTTYDLNVQIPKDKEQKEIAILLVSMAVKFVILHEIGHIYNGHTLYLNRIRDVGRDIGDLEMLTMDMDADAFAITRLVNEIISKFIEIEKGKKLYLVTYKYSLIQILSISIFGVLQLIYSDYKSAELTGKRQLPIEVRIVKALGCIKINIENLNLFGIDEEYVDECIWSSVGVIGNFYSTLYGEKDELDQFIKNINEYNINLDDDIRETWKQLRVNLIKYARCKLAE
ncbi:hypothetical protein ACQPU1_07595 [Clostridium paraputrificum]|uniref:hypothetical protein n=1 Tax=Clostridium paraputrificum TaxID=29363 RepID=UPI003D34EB68